MSTESSQPNPSASLRFIHQEVIDRLIAGTFVPVRQQRRKDVRESSRSLMRSDNPTQDRRDNYSPLAITKRCIHYDPAVFDARVPQILKLIEMLNNPAKKLMMIGAEQGMGKTSMVRGVIELMGGGKEQLLWFDANRHTDYEEIIHYLIQYIIYLAPHKQRLAEHTGLDKFGQLDLLIRGMQDIPLLLVLDNMEYLVDSSLRLNSHPFKEVLNFLLKYPNIKMILIGERLPYADLNASLSIVDEMKLPVLTEDSTTRLLEKKNLEKKQQELPSEASLSELADHPHLAEAFQMMYRLTGGYPWLLKAMVFLHQKSGRSFESLVTDMMKPAIPQPRGIDGEHLPVITPIEMLVRFIYEGLSDTHKKAMQLMVCLRHPVDMRTLAVMIAFCFPESDTSNVLSELAELDHSLIRPVMKVNYPPQDVIAHLRKENENRHDEKFKPWYELYAQFKKIAYPHIPAFERTRLHSCLHDFYKQEKTRQDKEKNTKDRLLRLKGSALVVEARYHYQAVQKRRPILTESISVSSSSSNAEGSSSGLSITPVGQRVPYYESSPNTQPGVFMTTGMSQGTNHSELMDIQLSEDEKRLLLSGNVISNPGFSDSAVISTPSAEPAPLMIQSLESTSGSELPTDLSVNNPHDETEKQIQKKLAEAVTQHNKPELFRQLLALAEYRLSARRFDAATECLEKAGKLDNLTEAMQLTLCYWRGRLKKETYYHNEAVQWLNKARSILARQTETAPSSRWYLTMAEIETELADIFEFRNQYSAAITSVQAAVQALNAYREANTDQTAHDLVYGQYQLGELQFRLALLFDDIGQVDQALSHYQQILDQPNHHSTETLALSLVNVGSIYAERQQFDTANTENALNAFKQALTYERQANLWDEQIKTLDSMALIYEESGQQRDQAEKCYKEALSVAVQQNNHVWKADCYLKLGNFYAAARDWDNALTHYHWAKEAAHNELSESSLNYIDKKIRHAESARHQSNQS